MEWLVVVQEEWHDRSDIPDALRNRSTWFLFFKLKEGISKLNQANINVYHNIHFSA